MSQKNIIYTVISVISILGFMILVYIASDRPAADDKVYAQVQSVEKDDNMKWSAAKKVLLVEYSDLQCPACASFHEMLKSIEADTKSPVAKNVTFVYRHYPLERIHKNARAAALASEAAANQKAFFPMSALMLENQKDWETSNDVMKIFTEYAKELKLDTAKFATDVKSKEVADRVNNDVITGNAVGVDSTPSFYLNGKKMQFSTIDDFKSQLTAAIQ